MSPGNIFGSPFKDVHLEAHPMKDLTYMMRNIKSTRDKLDSLMVSASISVEFPMGKISGSASYTNVDTKKMNQEELECDYKLSTYVVRVRPNAVELVDPIMKARIVDGKSGL
jgi:hypothetical protein